MRDSRVQNMGRGNVSADVRKREAFKVAKTHFLSTVASHAGADVVATLARDPAAVSYLQCVLFLKGFHATSAHRVAAAFWRAGDDASRPVWKPTTGSDRTDTP